MDMLIILSGIVLRILMTWTDLSTPSPPVVLAVIWLERLQLHWLQAQYFLAQLENRIMLTSVWNMQRLCLTLQTHIEESTLTASPMLQTSISLGVATMMNLSGLLLGLPRLPETRRILT